MGIDHQIPVTPMDGIADKAYAKATRVPSEIMVSMTDIPGFLTAR